MIYSTIINILKHLTNYITTWKNTVLEKYISSTNPTHAINSIEDKAKSGSPSYICVTNIRMIRYSGTDKEYQELMLESFMNLPDGTPLTWCGKLWGKRDISCTSGPNLFRKMLERGDNGIKHFLLGDTQDVLDALKEKYSKEYNTNIVGTYSPPFANVDEFRTSLSCNSSGFKTNNCL